MIYSMRNFLFILLSFVGLKSDAQQTAKGLGSKMLPALSSIRQIDLRQDLYALAGDSMRGRRSGTVDELRAAAWVAQQAQKAGLKPAGDNGTYFQFFSLQRTVTSNNSTIKINDKKLRLWKDVWVTEPVEKDITGTVVWLSSLADASKQQVKGSIVAMTILPPSPLPPLWVSLWGFRYVFYAASQQSEALKALGAKAVILVADSTAMAALTSLSHELDFDNGTYDLPGDNETTGDKIPVILVDQKEATDLQSSVNITAILHENSFLYPSVNVVAKVPGTDLNLKNEYVLYSGHHDHDGIGDPIAGDSIWNGADDNASVCVALLAIGRAFVKQPAKRSALFVWHGAEERGLLGSRWYSGHPTVKKEDIIAVINGDMIGRNNADSAALLGVTKPHRNSMDLVNAAYEANRQTSNFKIDTTWDNTAHPEFWYFRSDHLPYAQAGIPAIFFSTLLHPDYHTPKDEPARINYAKLTRMAAWMYGTGWIVANKAKRPSLDKSTSK